MTGILAYGSLVHPDENGGADAMPVRVKGYRRVFDQMPSWREGVGFEAAVLNVATSAEHWINAVCLLVPDEHIAELQAREQGYDLVTVDAASVSAYDGHTLPEDATFAIYVGKPGKQDAALLPNRDYLLLCLEGSACRGDVFRAEFIETTWIASGRSLRQYLDGLPC